jgi:hypothetical protein
MVLWRLRRWLRQWLFPDSAIEKRIALMPRSEAEARAERLLLSYLTPRQARQYERVMYVTIRSQHGNLYNIWWSGVVARLHPHTRVPDQYYGIAVRRHPPAGDNMLALKLLLETDEDEFLDIACEYSP